jgi:Ca2+-binding RTX toxin-like protein
MPIFTGTNGPDTIKGGGEADIIELLDGNDTGLGGGGNDLIFGSDGDDRLDGEDGNDELFGGRDDDQLSGGNGSDVLNGGSGFDRMSGGAGSDTFVLNADADDVDGGDGFDTIDARLLGQALSLNLNLGRITIAGKTTIETGVENAIGSGTADTLIGDGDRNVLDGGFRGDDTLIGLGGDDRLIGGKGADLIDGGAGIDTADYEDAGAGITLDLAQGGGSGGDAAGDSFVGIENVEGSEFSDSIVGDAGANRLDGNDGIDVLKGAGGADSLSGGSDNDNLSGGDGNDRLQGGGGADTMAGGNGDDVYVVDNAGDTVDETGGSGLDRVESLISFSLASNTTGAVENLALIGFGNLNGVGNALANTLIGNNGANNLNGNSGADLMQGRGGNDSYVVNEAGDVVDESLFGSFGTDEVLSFVSFNLSGPKALGAIENLRLGNGTANLNAHGNALANTLVGNDGVNVITGAAGNDRLTGDGGNDFFVFTTALNAATNVDVIEDYTVPQDTMRLENLFFTGLSNGTLAASAFRVGTTAIDASDRIIYNDDTGALFFDRDGTGAAAKVQFATLDAGLAMSNQEFLVI